MNKIKIIMLAGAGVVSFAAGFGATLLMKKAEPALPVEVVSQEAETGEALTGTADVRSVRSSSGASEGLSRGMSEKQLQNLIYDMREKMKDYRARENNIGVQEERLKTARDNLQADIARLDNLRMQLTSTISSLRQQEASLSNRMLEIKASEKANIQSVASRYDKMDVSQASKIMVSMVSNNQLDDAAKIVYYMSERTSGKLLGEIGNTQPDVAVVLVSQLKRMKEIQ
ncbi:MAG: hypothetical protein ACYTFK_08780 [Planctomycetota bacterium]|jgi:chromosome segregation ATPase